METAKTNAFQISSTLSKVLLQWLRQLPSPFHTLSRNISREISLYLSTCCLIPAVRNSTLRIYNLDCRLVKEGQLARSFSTAAVPCLIASDVVLYIGGYPPYTAEAFAVSLITYGVTDLPQMTEARGWPGVIQYEDFVYVFGGNSPQLLSAEMYAIKANRWVSVPDMIEGRYSFTPCLYKEEIYLADCMSNQKVIEVFDPQKKIYRQLSVHLPPIGNHSVSFILNDDFHVLSYQYNLGTLRLKPLAAEFNVTIVTADETSKGYSGCPPIVLETFAYFANYVEGNLTRFDAEQLTLKSYDDFSLISSN